MKTSLRMTPFLFAVLLATGAGGRAARADDSTREEDGTYHYNRADLGLGGGIGIDDDRGTTLNTGALVTLHHFSERDERKDSYGDPTSDPMYFVGLDGRYNMIGTSTGDGASGLTTSVGARAVGGVGYSLLDRGRQGCDFYVMATGEVSADLTWKDEDTFHGVAAPETGLMCDVKGAVLMLSPYVGAGVLGASNYNDRKDDPWAGPLEFGVNARAYLGDRVAVSLNTAHLPVVFDAELDEEGGELPQWSGDRTRATIDIRLNDRWTARAQLDADRLTSTDPGAAQHQRFEAGAYVGRAF